MSSGVDDRNTSITSSILLTGNGETGLFLTTNKELNSNLSTLQFQSSGAVNTQDNPGLSDDM